MSYTPKGGHGYGNQKKRSGCLMVIRRSVSFTETSLKAIQKWRVEHSSETSTPDFSEAVNSLIIKQ